MSGCWFAHNFKCICLKGDIVIFITIQWSVAVVPVD